MIPAILARQLDAQAQVIKLMANGIRASGHPIEIVKDGRPLPLHQLTSLDLDTFAEELVRDADKLRNIYH